LPRPPIHNDTSLKPIAVAILGVFSFAILDALLKSVAIRFPTVEVVFLRFASASVFATALLIWSRPKMPTGEAVFATFLRACATVGATAGFVYAVAVLPLANAVVLAYSAPFFMALFGWLLLGEPVSRRAAGAIAVGFAGIIVTMAGRLATAGSMEMALGSGSAILSGACYALSMILARKRSAHDTVEFTVWGQSVFSSLIVLPFAISGWQPVDTGAAVSFGAIGLAAVVAQCLVVWAFMHAAATRVAPIEFTSILWAGTFGFLFFGEPPGVATLIGALLIAVSGLMVANQQSSPVESG
jgi:S-adenosylmethionine uptake transporter